MACRWAHWTTIRASDRSSTSTSPARLLGLQSRMISHSCLANRNKATHRRDVVAAFDGEDDMTDHAQGRTMTLDRLPLLDSMDVAADPSRTADPNYSPADDELIFRRLQKERLPVTGRLGVKPLEF